MEGKEDATMKKAVALKNKAAVWKAPRCPHGYRSTNPVTLASYLCWNVECHHNG